MKKLKERGFERCFINLPTLLKVMRKLKEKRKRMSVMARDIRFTLELNCGFCLPRTTTTNVLPTTPAGVRKEEGERG